jgi:hypothetical protein
VRASQPALLAAGRVIVELRDAMVTQWADWLGDRITAAPTIPRPTVEREFRLLIDVVSEMVGPLRREVNTIWFKVCEHYGRVASARGLAAGEVVEELQFLRELLTRNLAPVLAAMRARQGMAIMLRLNRVIDKGIAVAVVGWSPPCSPRTGCPRPAPSTIARRWSDSWRPWNRSSLPWSDSRNSASTSRYFPWSPRPSSCRPSPGSPHSRV